MTQENLSTASKLSKSEAIIGTLLVIALFLLVSYLVAKSFPVTLPALSWTIVFTIAFIFRDFWVTRRDPPVRRRYVPGELTINTCLILLVGFFVFSIPGHADFLELVMANLWPLLLGSVTAVLIYQIYYSVRVFRE